MLKTPPKDMVQLAKVKIISTHYPANWRIRRCIPEEQAWGEVWWGIFVLFYGKEHLARKSGPKSYNGKKEKSLRYTPSLSLFYLRVMEVNPRGSKMIQVRFLGLN